MLLGAISYPLYIFQTPIHNIYSHFISKPLNMQPGVDFIFFLMLFMLFATVLTIIENYTFKRIYKRISQQGLDSWWCLKCLRDQRYGSRLVPGKMGCLLWEFSERPSCVKQTRHIPRHIILCHVRIQKLLFSVRCLVAIPVLQKRYILGLHRRNSTFFTIRHLGRKVHFQDQRW